MKLGRDVYGHVNSGLTCTDDRQHQHRRRARTDARASTAGARPPRYLPESGNSMLTVVPRPTCDASVTRSPIF